MTDSLEHPPHLAVASFGNHDRHDRFVAGALLALAGGARPISAQAMSFTSGTDVVGRVEALLNGAPEGGEEARRLGRGAAAVALICVLAACGAADPLHHLFETLLGGI